MEQVWNSDSRGLKLDSKPSKGVDPLCSGLVSILFLELGISLIPLCKALNPSPGSLLKRAGFEIVDLVRVATDGIDEDLIFARPDATHAKKGLDLSHLSRRKRISIGFPLEFH